MSTIEKKKHATSAPDLRRKGITSSSRSVQSTTQTRKQQDGDETGSAVIVCVVYSTNKDES